MSTNETRLSPRQSLYQTELASEIKQIQSQSGGRKWEYLTENKGKVALSLGLTVSSGALAGGVIGGVCGGVCGAPGGPPGVVGGTLIGVGVGSVIGAAVGGAYLTYDYHQWLKTDEGKRVGGTMIDYVSKDSVFENFVCAITCLPVINPVKTPDGHIYEKAAIEKWLGKNDTDPLTRKKLTKNDLKPATEISIQMAKRMAEIIEEDSSFQDLDEGVKNGLNALKGDIERKRDADFNAELKLLQTEKTQRKITLKEFNERMDELFKKYY